MYFYVIPVFHFLFSLDYVHDRFLPDVPSKPFLAVCLWRVFVLPFSQTSLVMVTLNAHGLNENYSCKNYFIVCLNCFLIFFQFVAFVPTHIFNFIGMEIVLKFGP